MTGNKHNCCTVIISSSQKILILPSALMTVTLDQGVRLLSFIKLRSFTKFKHNEHGISLHAGMLHYISVTENM